VALSPTHPSRTDPGGFSSTLAAKWTGCSFTVFNLEGNSLSFTFEATL
jgi:hypothetical protein